MTYIYLKDYRYDNVKDDNSFRLVGRLTRIRDSHIESENYYISKNDRGLIPEKTKTYEFSKREIDWSKCVPNKFA
jgi:hypothetical protein